MTEDHSDTTDRSDTEHHSYTENHSDTIDHRHRPMRRLNDSDNADSQSSISRSPIPMTWRNRAACLDEDPELFFPIGNTGPALLQIEEAKAVCRRCEVVETCLKWAIESGQDAGVWGGLSEDERRALKRRNARARRAG
jgi:WhiB family transcriptional regulator, redox-sensing transcriptional regulator